MRVAVGLPSLDAGDPLRGALDETFAQLVEGGHDIEGFAEHDRTGETLAFPVYHYLRAAERHATAAFDTALYPLGRDASPYQGIYAMMHRLPGVVWFLDPIVHHLAVGGIALMGDWFAYRGLLDEAYGDRGAAVAQTVACNWGTGALFRRYDLLGATAASQPHVIAAWPALATRIAERLDGREVGVVPIPLPDGDAGAANAGATSASGDTPPREDDAAVRRIAIMTVNESYATSAVRAAAAAFDAVDGAVVTICTSEPIYKSEGRRVAEQYGVHDRIDWRLTTSPQRLAGVVAESDVLLWLAEELQCGHRLLLMRGLAAGKPTVTPRCSLYNDLPEGAVAKLDLGRGLAPNLGALLGALRDDAALRRGLSCAARDLAADQPSVSSTTARLVRELDAAHRRSPLRQRHLSQRAWGDVRTAIIDAVLPGGSSPGLERRLDRILRSRLAGLGT